MGCGDWRGAGSLWPGGARVAEGPGGGWGVGLNVGGGVGWNVGDGDGRGPRNGGRRGCGGCVGMGGPVRRCVLTLCSRGPKGGCVRHAPLPCSILEGAVARPRPSTGRFCAVPFPFHNPPSPSSILIATPTAMSRPSSGKAKSWCREDAEAFGLKFRNEMPTTSITHIMKTLKKSFSGKDALEWILKQPEISDRDEAEAVGQLLLMANVFVAALVHSNHFVPKRRRIYRMLVRLSVSQLLRFIIQHWIQTVTGRSRLLLSENKVGEKGGGGRIRAAQVGVGAV